MDNEIRNEWLDIISKMYKDLHNSKSVMHVSKESDKRRERLINYFNRLEEVHNNVSKSKSKSGERLLKDFYYDLYVIKEEDIPESYYQNQVRLARERGHGNIILSSEDKKRIADAVIEDQKRTLDKWIEYFLYDEESKNYEMWEKYWVFQGLQSLGKYDKKTFKFSKRDKTTVYPFPPVEREYIFTTLHLMEEYLKNKKSDNDIKSALGSGDFKQLYEYVIKQDMLREKVQSNTTNGKWVKYEQGSDYNILRNSLQGYYTGWCTAAGENFAKNQLANGDFYVYYTLDNNGEAKVPRIAIRMNGKTKIGEIRGIANNQNMEPEMMPMLEEKLKEFPDRDKYLKKEHDMKLLTLIDKKVNNNIELTLNELRFLYEVDNNIVGFGYEKDPRIEEIKNKRNIKKDYGLIFNVKEEEVSLSQSEWIKNPKKFKILLSDLNLPYLTNAKDLVLPKYISGYLDLSGLTSADGLVLPENIGEYLDLSGLTSAEGLVLPKNIGGDLYLDALTHAKKITFPHNIDGDLFLDVLTNAKGFVLPKNIGGNLTLYNLTNAKDLILPKYIGESLDLRSLISTEGLILPKNIDGDLDLSGLTSAEGLVLPKCVGRDLDLSGLTSAEGLVLPKHVGGDLDLSELTTAEGLVLPKCVGGSLFLSSLTSAKGLVLPQLINHDLDLCSLTTAEGLVLPLIILGDLNLNSLTTTKGLILPKFIGCSLSLNSLTSVKGLVFSERTNISLFLKSLTKADGLKLPYNFHGRLFCPDFILEEIRNNRDKYYMEPPDEEENISVHHKR